MKKTLMALAVALTATPIAAADSGTTISKPQAKKSSKPAIHETQPRSAYSTNPEYDVYFRGEYVGSDPDPRVRWTLRDEARRSYGLNN